MPDASKSKWITCACGSVAFVWYGGCCLDCRVRIRTGLGIPASDPFVLQLFVIGLGHGLIATKRGNGPGPIEAS